MQLDKQFTEELVPGQIVSLIVSVTEPDGSELTADQVDQLWELPTQAFREAVEMVKAAQYFEGEPTVQTCTHEASFHSSTTTVAYQLEVTAGVSSKAVLCGLARLLHPVHHVVENLDKIRHPEKYVQTDSPLAMIAQQLGLTEADLQRLVAARTQLSGASAPRGGFGGVPFPTAAGSDDTPNTGLYL